MPRKPRIPSYRKHTSGQARVTLNGKDHLLGPYDSPESHQEYDRLITEWLLERQRPPAPSSAEESITINELILAYWTHAEEYYGFKKQRRGDESNLRDALRIVRSLYGRTPANDFGPKALKACREKMIEKEWSRGYVNDQVARIKRTFRWGAEEELIQGSVYQNLRAVAGLRKGKTQARESVAVVAVDTAVVEATLPHLSPTIQAMVRLQLLTGMRPTEVCIMRACDIDVTGKIWIYRPHSHKTQNHGKQREIYLGPQAQEVLRAWLKVDSQAYLFSPKEAEAARHVEQRRNRRSPMTPSQRKRKPKSNPRRAKRDLYDVTSYRNAIYRACDKAFPPPESLARRERESMIAGKTRLTPQQREELKSWQSEHRWHPNQLRHSAATAIRKSYGIELARIVLGHSRAFTTEIYAEADQQSAMEVIAKIG